MEREIEQKNNTYSPFAIAGLIVAVVSVLAELMAGLGTRWDLWNYRTGLTILRWSAYGGIGAGCLSLAGCLLTRPGSRRRGFALSLIGLLAGIVVVGIPLVYRQTAGRVPAIHDITTSTDDPPQLVVLAPLRQQGLNPAAYGGPSVAAQQRAAYPDIVPLELPLPPAAAFTLALNAARSLKWQIADADPQQGKIEATDRTFWFGFKDDIVVRVTPSGAGSRIDVRSVSRVGKSDLGTNAKRIRVFLKVLQEKG